MKHHLGQYSYTVNFPPVMNGGASALATLPVAPPAEGERQDNYPDKGSSVPGCSPSGASPSGACRLELVSSRLPSYTTTTTTAAAAAAMAFSMHFVSSLCDEQDTNTMKLEHEHADVHMHSRKTAEWRQSLWE